MSQFILLFRTDAASQHEAVGTPERAQRSLELWMRWIESLEASGTLADRGRPLEQRGKVVRANATVTDGPYVESKDLVIGFLTVTADDLDAAARLAAGCPIISGGGGSVEVRPIHGGL